MTIKGWAKMLTAVVVLGTVVSANAVLQNFSFTGNLVQDNTVQFFQFTVGAASPNVILRTWSYAGGVNAAGQTIARGGFDPILAVFDSAGTYINQNDDGGLSVAADAVTGAHYDTYLSIGALAAGTYTASVMQYNNFANGPTLADGFYHGNGTAADAWFTRTLTGHTTGGFYDVAGGSRDSHWAFDILNVDSSVVIPVPEPTTMIAGALLLLPFGASALRSLRKRQVA